MKISPAGIDLIKKSESCRLKAYKCPAGKWTISYGLTGDWVHEGMEISQDEADQLFNSHLVQFDASVQRLCPDAAPNQHSAMVSLAYNIGTGAFAKSSVCRLHNAGRFAEAAQAFALWNRAGGKVLSGLVKRRAAEAALYLEGADVTSAPNADGEKPLTTSRTINGQAIAGAATVIPAAASALPHDWTDQIKEALTGIPADWATYAVLGLTLLGIGLSVYARVKDRRDGRA